MTSLILLLKYIFKLAFRERAFVVAYEILSVDNTFWDRKRSWDSAISNLVAYQI